MNETPLTPAVFSILLALSDGEKHGYAIMREVEVSTEGAVRMGPGTLYGSLDRMLKGGLIEEHDPIAGSRSNEDDRRRYYKITGTGRGALEREVNRMNRAVKLARSKKVFLPA